MPNLAGQPAGNAKGALPEGIVASFVVAAQDPQDASQAFTVATQSVAAGSRVPKGTRVVLSIYRGWREPAATVPDVTGRRRREAAGLLGAAGLRVRGFAKGGPAPDPSSEGLVARTLPAAGDAVPGDRAVTIELYGPFQQPEAPKPPEPPPQPPPPPEQPPKEKPPEGPKVPSPEAAPFMGTWEGTWQVEDSGKDAWLGPQSSAVAVELAISAADDGSLKVERVGSDLKMTAKMEGVELVVEWPLDGGTATMRLQVERNEIRGGVLGVTTDGAADGIAQVRMKREK